jgi:hypothetical protein
MNNLSFAKEKIKTKEPVGFKNQTLNLLRAAEDTLSKIRGLQVEQAGDLETANSGENYLVSSGLCW